MRLPFPIVRDCSVDCYVVCPGVLTPDVGRAINSAVAQYPVGAALIAEDDESRCRQK